MSWAFPLTAQITHVQQQILGRVFLNPNQYTVEEDIECDLQPKGSEAMFQEFGVEIKFGAGFYVPVEHGEKLRLGYVVTVAGKNWRIAGEASVRAYGSALDHASVPLERLDLQDRETVQAFVSEEVGEEEETE
ncbi:hypothetical protein EON81_10715 [bacterium]|nr:MAG: hypothetical protein EON81_10715 [bacterium]